jgi:hypothetical protein
MRTSCGWVSRRLCISLNDERAEMKIVVIGGTGLIGSRLVKKLREDGHDPIAASPDTGVDTLTGEGLAEALEGAQVVVDVSNAPAWEDADSGYFRAKLAQEEAVKAATVPYTLLRHRARRALAHPRRRRTHSPDALRVLARGGLGMSLRLRSLPRAHRARTRSRGWRGAPLPESRLGRAGPTAMTHPTERSTHVTHDYIL